MTTVPLLGAPDWSSTVVDFARQNLQRETKNRWLRVAGGAAAVVVGGAVAAYLGLSHPAGQTTPSSHLQTVGAILAVGGFGLSVWSSYLAFCWGRAVWLIEARRPQCLLMTSTSILTSTGRGGLTRIRYAVLSSPDSPEVPVAVMQALSSAASLPDSTSTTDVLFFGDPTQDRVMLALNRDATTVVGLTTRSASQFSKVLRAVGMSPPPT